MSAPDGITPVEGYRAWRWDGAKLCPTNVGLPWVPGVNEAYCYYSDHLSPRRVRRNVGGKVKRVVIDDHDLIPDENCNCGLWFLHSLDAVFECVQFVTVTTEPWNATSQRPIYGKVKGWGKVLVGKRGHRSEFAEILCLYAPDNDPEWRTAIEQAAEAYGVPVEVTPRVNGWVRDSEDNSSVTIAGGSYHYGGHIRPVYLHGHIATGSITLPESGASHVRRSRDPHGFIYGTVLVAATFVLIAILNAGMS